MDGWHGETKTYLTVFPCTWDVTWFPAQCHSLQGSKHFVCQLLNPQIARSCNVAQEQMDGKKSQSERIHVSVFKRTYFHFSMGNFCHRKWVLLPNSVAMVAVHDMGRCFVWDGPSNLWGSISVTGLQRHLGLGSLQLDVFYHSQGNFLLFTLRWVSWSHPWTKLSQDFQSLNISSPSKHTLPPWFPCKTGGLLPNRLLACVFLAAKVQVNETLQARGEKKSGKE